jgi:hypothetical protein
MKMISMAKMPMSEMLVATMWIAEITNMSMVMIPVSAMSMILVTTVRHADSQFLTEQPLHTEQPIVASSFQSPLTDHILHSKTTTEFC